MLKIMSFSLIIFLSLPEYSFSVFIKRFLCQCCEVLIRAVCIILPGLANGQKIKISRKVFVLNKEINSTRERSEKKILLKVYLY